MTLVRAASAHPRWAAALAVAAAVALAVFWYLASPLWVRTYREEALPTAGIFVQPARTLVPGTPAPSVAPPEPRILLRGQLGYVDGLHNGRGEVRIVDLFTSRILRFESVAITNAPDVHVYLSRDSGGKWAERTSLYLGPLKATNGSFNYELPAGTDLAPYKSVVVWCRAFNVLVTWADLG